MKVDMIMPQMGESITEATISRWIKNPGDSVEKDEMILEISTDKVDSEIPAPASGVLSEVLFNEGDVVPVKEKIAVIDTDASATSTPSQPAAAEEPAAEEPAEAPAAASEPPATPEPQAQGTSAQPASGRFYSPLVRSLADKHGISLDELEQIHGSGQGGRVTKQDFMNYLNNKGGSATASQPQQPSSPPAAQQVQTARPVQQQEYTPKKSDMPGDGWDENGVKAVPMDKMRQIIADHMVRSKQTSPHVYSVQEVDCSRIAAYRAKHKNEFKKREGFNLSYTPFFLEAAVRGLKQFPGINASVEDNTILLKRDINLGCAVALGNTGLIVPVIKKADEKNFVGICRGLNDLALRARDKKLLPEEVMGGTFTVTNPGVFGTMIGTPIINQPQVAILCLGAIKKRPVVVDDMIAVREICYLTLSYDHRIVDGALGGQYLKFVREYLEGWDLDRPLY